MVESSPEGNALTASAQNKRYADKYRDSGQPLHLIEVEFSKQQRCVTGFEAA